MSETPKSHKLYIVYTTIIYNHLQTTCQVNTLKVISDCNVHIYIYMWYLILTNQVLSFYNISTLFELIQLTTVMYQSKTILTKPFQRKVAPLLLLTMWTINLFLFQYKSSILSYIYVILMSKCASQALILPVLWFCISLWLWYSPHNKPSRSWWGSPSYVAGW